MRRRTRKNLHVLGVAAGLGAVAGLRSLTAPAVVTLAANRRWVPRRGPTSRFGGGRSLGIAAAMAVGEMIVDKTAVAPDRRVPPSLAWRIGWGAFVGASVCAAKRAPVAAGALVGGLGAVAGTFAGSKLRRMLSTKTPPVAAALIEDGIAAGTGILLGRVA